MKTLLLSLTLLVSSQAFSGEKSFECNARYFFGDKQSAAITGIITSDTTLSDVSYSIDEQPEFSAGVLTPARTETAPRFAFHREYKISGSNFTLYMPYSMNNMDHFTAIVGNTKTFERLECVIEI